MKNHVYLLAFFITLLIVPMTFGASEHYEENEIGQTSLQSDSRVSDLTVAPGYRPYLGRVGDCYYYWGVGLRSQLCARLGNQAGYPTQWLVGLGGTVCDCYGHL